MTSVIHWGGTLHPIWNALAALLWLLYLVAVALIPSERFARGWRSKVWWMLAALLSAEISGLFIPLGVILAWPVLIRRYRRGVPRSKAGGVHPDFDSGAHPFYPQPVRRR